MIAVQYPQPSFKTKQEQNGLAIFDELRKTWLKLTPEEWVRQNFVQYLLKEMQYPSSLIALEKQLLLGELTKRFDILVYDRDYKPWMMVECKSMNVKLDSKVLEQVLRYNISIPVRFLVITNGHACYGFDRSAGRLEELEKLPVFE
ncbi:MAG TPA: type I restriction enzyme HsdR N-terminal domain-containing protein [Flavitalea sp.]|nr:type I restriction enzyme HsdR N-terminal domain-containing protein [Flavitalea sp.]